MFFVIFPDTFDSEFLTLRGLLEEAGALEQFEAQGITILMYLLITFAQAMTIKDSSRNGNRKNNDIYESKRTVVRRGKYSSGLSKKRYWNCKINRSNYEFCYVNQTGENPV